MMEVLLRLVLLLIISSVSVEPREKSTQIMFPTSLLLLLAAMTCTECNIVLTQMNSIVLQPGHSLTLTCEVSGYSVTDNSYATAWIRHPAGKALEWIVHIWGGGGITKKDSLSDRFSISKSDSSNTVTLKGQNLQTEDTAVYYCARRPQHEKTAQALYMNCYLWSSADDYVSC
ncbi:hypothetical protein G5714_003513 [Onychostoma macrolepis]|uniref:Ig-like domain-containing protein n=1 Tax=Onychostoma macrolepis TaxID=369639 RepID=A0A7J6DAX7_9TELE|nr:hypothetical protein G5714_003513 [Onychostoma macrolepis]